MRFLFLTGSLSKQIFVEHEYIDRKKGSKLKILKPEAGSVVADDVPCGRRRERRAGCFMH